ncbi:uncharacterized protein T551_01828 [Pneumocystis jirovecii RU7]|uniref:Ubiquitin-like domain-containing protein n=1 Tax=Pneumocystis jirovecii (strain RU7) TaxID=1408657 RepID=A0A0W4ZQA7_PNEJ7|nr:uncharacterized protein T551_01828 [Pneumocystis jirovecii RU7]KTW30545.1 hypothetical protein T551_01828 [Pneumocystis jirovecii RU7]
MEAEKCFARSFLQQLEQKPVKFSEEFIAPLSRLDIVPQEVILNEKKKLTKIQLNLPEINLPQWDGLNEVEKRDSEQIDITIKTLRGPKKTTNIKARHSDTIYCIKKSVSNAFNVDLSQIRLLNKGKVLMDTKLVSDILESNQTKALLQLMIMEKKVPAEKTQISCKITEPTTTTQNETVQLLKLDTSFWEDLKAFLSTKLDSNTCHALYNIFKQAYANTKT